MYPWSHFIFAYLIGLIFTKFGLIGGKHALIIGILAVLVDIDHYIGFIIDNKFKDFKIKDAWNNSSHYHRLSERTFIHHKIGMIIVTILVMIFLLLGLTKLFLIISISYYTHILLDYIHIRIIDTKKLWKIKEKGFIINITYNEVIFDIISLATIMVLIR